MEAVDRRKLSLSIIFSSRGEFGRVWVCRLRANKITPCLRKYKYLMRPIIKSHFSIDYHKEMKWEFYYA